jgi:hypothetical protein
MDLQNQKLITVPTGEVERTRGEEEADQGVYFALSYRKKRVCIDSGLRHVLQRFVGAPNDEKTRSEINHEVSSFLESYSTLWWKHPRTGEFLEMKSLACEGIKDILALTPHYKVPNAV